LLLILGLETVDAGGIELNSLLFFWSLCVCHNSYFEECTFCSENVSIWFLICRPAFYLDFFCPEVSGKLPEEVLISQENTHPVPKDVL